MYLKNKCTKTEMMVSILNRKVIELKAKEAARGQLWRTRAVGAVTPPESLSRKLGHAQAWHCFPHTPPGFLRGLSEESAAHPAWLRPSRPARRARNYGSQKAVRVEEGRAEAAGRAPEATVLGVFPRWSVRLHPRSGRRTRPRAVSPLGPGRWPGQAGASARRTGRGGM